MSSVPNNARLRGRLLLEEPMSRHTSWRVGGPADRYYQPKDIQDLSQFLCQLPEDEPVYWVGLGSNLLIRDKGVRGTVVATSGLLNGLSMVNESVIRAEAGVACAKVARFSVEHNLTGAEFLAGIPGTTGGALAMNAGAFGGETWKIVQSVETMDRQGVIRHRTPDQFQISYRHVKRPPNEWFISAQFGLNTGDAEKGRDHIKSLLAKRGATQPTQMANAGSVFMNPPGDYSARLIEASGLKGFCVGKACVSELHANFIVNTGGATAAEIETLIEKVQEIVADKQGVDLKPEVCIVGEAK